MPQQLPSSAHRLDLEIATYAHALKIASTIFRQLIFKVYIEIKSLDSPAIDAATTLHSGTALHASVVEISLHHVVKTRHRRCGRCDTVPPLDPSSHNVLQNDAPRSCFPQSISEGC